MHWQFGGNFEPVQMICEVDWKECPKAIANYIWSEIVTDVLDCLKNEEIVWRYFKILAVSFICTILLRLMFSKTKHVDDTVVENEIINKVGYKVEDLELKVNILTYKMQYGAWPLPHQIHKSNFRKNLRNLRLTLSNPNDRNDWIKHVLLSPRRKESYVSCPKYNYPSGYRLTELFDAKTKTTYPYFRRDALPLERSSKSSKSSSEIKLNSVFKRAIGRKQRKVSRSEHFEAQSRNALLSALCSRNRTAKSTSNISKNTKAFETNKMTGACKKFTKTMDECKRYLKELHDSNKNLGLVCSSSELSDESLMKNVWSKTEVNMNDAITTIMSLSMIYSIMLQQRMCTHENDLVDEKSEKNEQNEKGTDLNVTDSMQRSNKNYLELSNAVYPVLKLIDQRLRPSKMNITFCTDVFPRQSVSNMLVPQPCERKKFIETSQETLYQVKKKLESLHDVLRTYEIQNPDARGKDGQDENSKNINNICQNVMNTLVSATTEANNWNEERSRVSFDTDARINPDEMQQTIYISSEQYESDDTVKSSDLSIQNYCTMFNTCCPRNINELNWSLLKKSENKICSLSNQKLDTVEDNGCPFAIKYDKVPERIYYTISSDLFKENDINRETTVTENCTLPNICTENFNQHAIPMETDEDLIILSPTSSRTEMSKDSESDDKSTSLLLQEALQFKKALLTRVELEKVCCIDDTKENINSESLSEYSKCSYINNNLQSNILDIISEEQSVSSSTDRTSHTYMFFNVKQNKRSARSTIGNHITGLTYQTAINDQNGCREYFESNQNLSSPSKYFSFSNMLQKENEINANNCLQGNESAEMVPNNLQIKHLNHTKDNSDGRLMEMKFTNCLKHVETNISKHETRNNEMDERENSETHYLRMNNTNELINRNVSSVELFSQNLNETLFDEENQNPNKNEGCNFLDSESLKQCTDVSSMKNAEDDFVNTKFNLSDDEKYIEDNEILMSSPNFSLKRHPGACSLIEQTLITTSIENAAEMHMMLENVDAIYELSPSESKENSIETNLIQDSLTTSTNNHSNSSNIPEPPSVTVMINKSENEEFNLNWSNIKSNYSNDYVDEKDAHTISTNTITLQKYDCTDMENYDKHKLTCNDDTSSVEKHKETGIHYDQDDALKDEQNNSDIRDSLINLGKENSIDEADYKSYSNLISPHSSLYFTDEASSSIAKLNNTRSNHFDDYLHSNSNIQTDNKELHYQDKFSKDTENADLLSISQDIDEKLSNSENVDVPLFKETEQTPRKGNKILNDKVLISCIDTNNHTLLSPKNINAGDKTQSNFLVNKSNILNEDQNAFMTNTLSCQISPRDAKDNMTLKRLNKTMKSRSQENYTSRIEKLQKPIAPQNIIGLKSDLVDTVHAKAKSNTTPKHVRVRDLSVESRRNAECHVKLDKKQSLSQISFRSKKSAKHVTSQSYESPSNANTINYIHSLETKLKSHGKPILPIPKTSSRSCIPVLKSRLEAARRSENETRSKSPMRGPLTMTMLWKDDLCSKSENTMEESIKMEGKSENNEEYAVENNNYVKNTDDNQNHTDKQDLMKASYTLQNLSENTDSNITPQEQMVIYVNIYTKYDQNTTKIVDPNKFLEYIENRELNLQKETKENQSNKIDVEFSTDSIEKEKSIMHKIVTIVSSVINGNELDQNVSSESPARLIKNDSFTNAKLKHLCFLSVEQREIDVTAKPSVIDTSTSMSDLEKVSGTSKSVLNKFQICGTPKELNNDEYIAFLEILHQEPNTVHLQELQNVCKKLVSEYKKK
ncbi:uncharacterized protein LOC143347228 [Colletes latitarsis]|uniref:uncharacterized protein LOC143347228 n=1 Tax=Colletes latitarsis TaxID=2605962 RepID=UPI00403716ED